ncbi:MAG: sigma-70 family RNA polymerase sigma factor [Lachnospiraceae bacterium]|nr:sigma-70 family RNA polymerase sigma factor [Lachnospiraceae bacterium]
MNEDIILRMVQPYLKNLSITYGEFEMLFEMLSLREQYGVLEILNQNSIELRTEEEADADIRDMEASVDKESINADHFEILYDDSVFSGKDDEHEVDSKEEYARFLDVNRRIRQSNEILCVLIQQGNVQARQDLCIKNRRLVGKVANSYNRFAGNDLDLDDLEQAGMVGMLNAAEKFDPNLGYAFSTYAMWWIKQAIVREIYDHGFTIRVPVHMMEVIHRINVVDRDFSMTGIGYKEKLSKIAEELGMTEENIEQCLAVQYQFLNISSLDVPVGEAGDTEMVELIPDETIISVEDEVFSNMLKECVSDALQILTEREQKVLDLRYGLTDGRERTLEEVGGILGVTRERIRQIEQKAFRKIRHISNNTYLRDFLN